MSLYCNKFHTQVVPPTKKPKQSPENSIHIKGARSNNLKDIEIHIP